MSAQVLCLAGLYLTAPFVDMQGRFSIDLLTGWSFAPQPGDTKGTVFRRDRDGTPAYLRIHMSDGVTEDALHRVAKEVCAAAQAQPEYRLLSEARTEVGAHAAWRCRYVHALPNARTKMAEDVVLIVGRRGYVLHFESTAEVFAVLEDDFAALARSFEPRGVTSTQTDSTTKLIGRWQLVGDKDLVLELSADGTFDLAGTRGRYEASQAALALRPESGGQERFAWKLEGPVLVLTNSNLPEGARYERIGLSGKDVIGVWYAQDHSLEIRQGGRVIWNSASGEYSLRGERIMMRVSGKEHTFTVEVGDGLLTLRGDTFGPKGKTFERR